MTNQSDSSLPQPEPDPNPSAATVRPPEQEAAVARLAAKYDLDKPGNGGDGAGASSQVTVKSKPVEPSGVYSPQKNYPCTETGNAELFAELYGKDVRWDERRERWLLWNGCRWKTVTKERLSSLMLKAVRMRMLRAYKLRDPEECLSIAGKEQFKYALKSENRHIIENSRELAKSQPAILDNGEGWDTDPWVLGVKNGVVDLRTGELHTATREMKITKSTGVAYDPGAECPRWYRFIDEVFGGDLEMADYIQKIAGYCLTGDVSAECFFNLFGRGSNGKTKFLETLAYVLGEYAITLPFHVLEKSSYGQPDYYFARLDGCRLAIAAETREDIQLNESRIKLLTGGDRVPARVLYRMPYEFDPTHKLILAFNHKPVIADDSDSMWRRVRLIEFAKTFDADSRDEKLLGKLKAQASGILKWAVDGCLRWQDEGLKTPSKVVKATTEYDDESDPLASFLEDRCEESPDGKVDKTSLYAAYDAWCRVNGMKGKEILSKNSFSRKLKDRGLEDGNSSGRRFWIGLKLMLEDEDEELPTFDELEKAKQFLTKLLEDSGTRSASSEIMRQAKAAGISKKTIWRAKEKLKLDAETDGDEWIWLLPAEN